MFFARFFTPLSWISRCSSSRFLVFCVHVQLSIHHNASASRLIILRLNNCFKFAVPCHVFFFSEDELHKITLVGSLAGMARLGADGRNYPLPLAHVDSELKKKWPEFKKMQSCQKNGQSWFKMPRVSQT